MTSVDEKSDQPLIHVAEASNLVSSIGDRTTWQLLAMSTTDLVISLVRKERPAGQFDMLFFTEVMRDVCSQHALLRSILAGGKRG